MNRIFKCNKCGGLWRVEETDDQANICPDMECLGTGIKQSCNLKKVI